MVKPRVGGAGDAKLDCRAGASERAGVRRKHDRKPALQSASVTRCQCQVSDFHAFMEVRRPHNRVNVVWRAHNIAESRTRSCCQIQGHVARHSTSQFVFAGCCSTRASRPRQHYSMAPNRGRHHGKHGERGPRRAPRTQRRKAEVEKDKKGSKETESHRNATVTRTARAHCEQLKCSTNVLPEQAEVW